HKSVHPELGTLEDFRELVQEAESRGLQVALDLAYQCSPDHPYVEQHPEWFRQRPDGTIQYAENPPKKYQDIYPFDFECDDWHALWDELKSIVEFWIEQGVQVFRVDNPHTKPFRFWKWLIGEIRADHPQVFFLSEAFTRPKVMKRLAKVGFSQSYTYFAWRNTGWELREYLTELTQTPMREYFRPNFWPNTPDILTEYLQMGGPPAFRIRHVLAATLAAAYGIYGPAFEVGENRAREPGSEEYLNSEKYQIRSWDVEAARPMRDFIARVNRIRKQNPALHSNDSLRFHSTDNDQVLAYSKRTRDRANVVLVVVNLDPHHQHGAWLDLDLRELGVGPDETYQVHDMLSDARYLWRGGHNYVELDPHSVPAHIFQVRRRVRSERDFEYYL
ncbi:MAG: alpha-1,4-glucan--maltose-1-phosphate maltosyltransferase, partial [Anaerolineales bacterium]|nr:alpha-1,4-glucan--maltose-1-phosphate maltosyltransferase [Anaerolineales bacterium]